MAGMHSHPKISILLGGSLGLLLIFAAATPVLAQNITCVPDPQMISLADVTGGLYKDTVVVHYAGDGAVYGYSIDLTWDPDVITAVASDFAKPAGGAFASTQWFIPRVITAGHAIIDASLAGGSTGTTDDDLFRVTFTAVGTPDHATTNLDLTVLSFRDQNNNPLGGITADDGQVIVDLVVPSVTAVLIENTTLAHTDDYLKNTDAIRVTATVTDGDPGFALG
ncbi:MAG: hypothetical protein Q7W56_07150, partial [Candidatus Latescibacteria bacterium]|nr:hypothetical protein [Candidatus Latescibacterota bacterium]